ncbi:MAG: preprotein translocase subunit SecG [Planctomycetota bacterium]|jgi:preprotein translocase subunit SecG
MMAALWFAFGLVSFLKGILLFVFVLSALLLVLVILLQEPKGGGLSSAFGGVGAETFGVQTGGVNRFTSYVALAFLATAVLFAAVRPEADVAPSDRAREQLTAPEEPGDEGEPANSEER